MMDANTQHSHFLGKMYTCQIRQQTPLAINGVDFEPHTVDDYLL